MRRRLNRVTPVQCSMPPPTNSLQCSSDHCRLAATSSHSRTQVPSQVERPAPGTAQQQRKDRDCLGHLREVSTPTLPSYQLLEIRTWENTKHACCVIRLPLQREPSSKLHRLPVTESTQQKRGNLRQSSTALSISEFFLN